MRASPDQDSNVGRRFITVEDVRRTQGRELVVDEDTIVTPQALDAAAGAGITIRSGAGPYSEPAPDRGPDAPQATSSLPHMPEPAGIPDAGTGVVVTAIGRNRAGVLAEITGALSELDASVENISQKTIEGYFHLVLTVEIPSGAAFERAKERLECLGGQDDYVVRVMHERVFRFMHRV